MHRFFFVCIAMNMEVSFAVTPPYMPPVMYHMDFVKRYTQLPYRPNLAEYIQQKKQMSETGA